EPTHPRRARGLPDPAPAPDRGRQPVPGAMSRWGLPLRAAVLAALAGCARYPVLARAQPGAPASAEAARDFDHGVEAYERGEYLRALGSFQRAYALEPRPAVLYNLARVHEMLGHSAQAVQCYIACSRTAGALSAEHRGEIDAAVTRLQGRVGWLMVRAN